MWSQCLNLVNLTNFYFALSLVLAVCLRVLKIVFFLLEKINMLFSFILLCELNFVCLELCFRSLFALFIALALCQLISLMVSNEILEI